MHYCLILANQLFAHHPCVDSADGIVVWESPSMFGALRFHKQRLVLLRAAMRAYAERLRGDGHEVTYVSHGQDVVAALQGCTGLCVTEPVDEAACAEVREVAEDLGVEMEVAPSPGFVCSVADARAFFAKRSSYHQTAFYRMLREREGVLLDAHGGPLGGKWTYDTDNRKRLPEDVAAPQLAQVHRNEWIVEACAYVDRVFADNPGTTAGFNWPVTHAQAANWLERFVAERLDHFGDYQDAMEPGESFLFHSCLSSSINLGLLTPGQVIRAVASTCAASACEAHLNNVEGFVRQVLGWREYVRAMYALEGERLRESNVLGHQRPMPSAFYDGTTGLDPVDEVIGRVLHTGYAHHIERLMVLGNAMCLCEIAPRAVCAWFSELFVDAYDWVMVPNVYGMSQYAAGDLMTTKPYVSGSNYLRKMSRYAPGEWCEVWDGLYWRFIHKHKEMIRANPRMRVMVGALDRMKDETLDRHLRVAEDFLTKLHGED